MRILPVEDEEKVSGFIVRGLTAEGFAVDASSDGHSGLGLATTCNYDLIVLDLMLPVTGENVRAFNLGYFRPIGEMSRLGFDYQFKNRPSFNDDAVYGRFQLSWNIEF